METIRVNNNISNENTTDKVHSVFPPSSASRHLHCTPSLVMESVLPSETSEAAEEGTAAHALAEYKARCAFGMPVDTPRPVSEYDSEEMEECTDRYVRFLQEAYAKLNNPIVLLERVVHFDNYVAGGFGTADCIMLSDEELHIIDYKHGRIKVSATDNDQMKTYAVGALQDFGMAYPNVKRISVSICQPRIKNEVDWSIEVNELRKWANTVLRPKGSLALMGEGTLCEGEWCRYCKAKSFCALKNTAVVDTISRTDLEKKGLMLTKEDINTLLPLAHEAVAWGKSITDYAQKEAVENGTHWEGYKLVEGRSKREFADETAVVERAKALNMTESDVCSKPSVLSPSQLEKKVGKAAFKDSFSDLVTVKPGSPSLVPEDDPRKAIAPAPVPVDVPA